MMNDDSIGRRMRWLLVVGFLCADTMSELAFSDEMEVPYVNLMATFADGLYTVIARYKDFEAGVQRASR